MVKACNSPWAAKERERPAGHNGVFGPNTLTGSRCEATRLLTAGCEIHSEWIVQFRERVKRSRESAGVWPSA
jgi:hypothetical protein